MTAYEWALRSRLISEAANREAEVLCSAASVGAAKVVEKVTIPRVGFAALRGTPPTRLRTNEVEGTG
jgi:hypothetical protein